LPGSPDSSSAALGPLDVDQLGNLSQLLPFLGHLAAFLQSAGGVQNCCLSAAAVVVVVFVVVANVVSVAV